MKKPKYRQRKVIKNGITFDSQAEYRYFLYLGERLKGSEIADFEYHPAPCFILLPNQLDKNDKIVERMVTYTPDFKIHHHDGSVDVVDVKSKATKTQAYIIKRKLMLWVHGIRIKEVEL